MEKILTIDGHQVKFKSTGAFLLRYKAQFGRDALQDIFKISNAFSSKNGEIKDVEALDTNIFYYLIWTLAKTADKNIPELQEWLDSFGEFPLMDIIPEVMEMVMSTLTSSVASKKK